MNPSLVVVCLVLAFVAYTEADPVRDGWASGASKDRDPENPLYKQETARQRTQQAIASGSGKGIRASSFTHERNGNRVSVAQASGRGPVSSFASA